jgi:hypothetical protein
MPIGRRRSQHNQHFADQRMAHDVGLGQPHRGNIRDRLQRQLGQRGAKADGFKVPTQEVSGVLGSARNDVTTVWAHGD